MQLFLAVLKERFKDLGSRKIEQGEWFLEDPSTKTILDLSKPWHSLMKPDRVLHMNVTFRRHNLPSTQCPLCGFENPGVPEEEVSCICGLTYRRIEEIQEVDITEGDSSPRPDKSPQPKRPEARKEKSNLQSEFPRPRPKPQRSGGADEEIRSYKRVQIIDTSFLIRRASKGDKYKTRQESRKAALTVHDLQDLELVAAYLSDVYGLPEEECLEALQGAEAGAQLAAILEAYEQTVTDTKAQKLQTVEGEEAKFDEDQRSTSSLSPINNPRLLETVEDAIRRLILPELTKLRRERKIQQRIVSPSSSIYDSEEELETRRSKQAELETSGEDSLQEPVGVKVDMREGGRRVTLRRLTAEEATAERRERQKQGVPQRLESISSTDERPFLQSGIGAVSAPGSEIEYGRYDLAGSDISSMPANSLLDSHISDRHFASSAEEVKTQAGRPPTPIIRVRYSQLDVPDAEDGDSMWAAVNAWKSKIQEGETSPSAPPLPVSTAPPLPAPTEIDTEIDTRSGSLRFK
ncbi:hypothetical protein DL95DRAFT_452788 [Leptodontidium sp. 2 PMI_412]|nr:hypothetical protein DL95DRAFT_452788 [Leptodontidium sp. 2 PMI_412]